MPTYFNTKTNSKSTACFLFSQGVGASLSWFSLWDLSQKFGSASTLADQKNETAYVRQAGKIHAISGGRPVTPAISEGWQGGRRPYPQGQRHLGVRWVTRRWWSSGILLLLPIPCLPNHLFPSLSPHWNYYRPGHHRRLWSPCPSPPGIHDAWSIWHTCHMRGGLCGNLPEGCLQCWSSWDANRIPRLLLLG